MEKSHVGMTSCYFCGGANAILLDRRLRKSLPSNVGVVDMEPCNECKGYMKQGVIVMSIADDTTADEMKGEDVEKYGKKVGWRPPNPCRTGGWVVVKDEAIIRMTEDQPDYQKFALSKRFMFITSSAWNLLGFEPKVEVLTKEDVREFQKGAK